MAKFKLGDYVSYTNKSMHINEPWLGTIIACCPGANEYIVKWDIDRSKTFQAWWIGSKDIHRRTSTWLPHEFITENGGITTNAFIRSVGRNNSRISSNSRSIKHAELAYDPAQMGDRDDDI